MFSDGITEQGQSWEFQGIPEVSEGACLAGEVEKPDSFNAN